MPLHRPDEAGDYIPLVCTGGVEPPSIVWELSLYQVIGLVFGGLRIRLRGHQHNRMLHQTVASCNLPSHAMYFSSQSSALDWSAKFARIRLSVNDSIDQCVATTQRS